LKVASPKDLSIFLGAQLVGFLGSIAFTYALTLGTVALTVAFMGIQPLFVFVIAFLVKGLHLEAVNEDFSLSGSFLKLGAFVLVLVGLSLLFL
jgi:hypothetical protein